MPRHRAGEHLSLSICKFVARRLCRRLCQKAGSRLEPGSPAFWRRRRRSLTVKHSALRLFAICLKLTDIEFKFIVLVGLRIPLQGDFQFLQAFDTR